MSSGGRCCEGEGTGSGHHVVGDRGWLLWDGDTEAETQHRAQQRQVPGKEMSLASPRDRKATVAGTEAEGQQQEAFRIGHQRLPHSLGFT